MMRHAVHYQELLPYTFAAVRAALTLRIDFPCSVWVSGIKHLSWWKGSVLHGGFVCDPMQVSM